MGDFVRPDLRDRFTLLVPLPMPPAVRERIRSDRATWAGLTAPTDEAESDTAQVQRDRLVIDRNADRLYSDGVDHRTHLGRPSDTSQGDPQHSERGAATAEHFDRAAFLRRVQYVDPRERRA